MAVIDKMNMTRDETAMTADPLLSVVNYDTYALSYSEQINELNKRLRIKAVEELINSWQGLQRKYDELGDTAKLEQHSIKFHAKAQTYRYCWKALITAYCPDLSKLDVQKLRCTQSDAEFRRLLYGWLNNR
jgi:hypothetical protein